MENQFCQMVGGEKHISPHYAIKSENTSCDISSKGYDNILQTIKWIGVVK